MLGIAVLSTETSRAKEARFELDRIRLRFKDAEVERDFAASSFAQSIQFIRFYLFAAIALYSAFGLLDLVIGGSEVFTLLAIRFGLAVPAIIIILALSFTRIFERYVQLALASALLAGGLGVILMVSILPPALANQYYAGLIMVVVYSGSFLGLRFLHGLGSTLIILVAYQCVSLLINPIPLQDLVSNNFFLAMSSGVGVVSSYILDTHLRQRFIAQKIIEEKNAVMQVLLDQAEAANRAKSEFLTNMSHELRTPLNAIIGFSEIIRQEYLGPVGSPKYMDYATDIHVSGKHLLTIINDILDLARAESGQLVIREQIFDLGELLGGVHAQLAQQAFEARLDVNLKHDGVGVTVRGDQRLLRQVLLNILSNAIKFTPAGGRVAVLMEADTQTGVRVTVCDTGIGIPPEHVERVLRPFEQVERALSRSHGGAGLGLSYALKVVELHQGGLSIESAVGVGTTVRVTLPPSRLDVADEEEPSTRTLDLA